MKSTSLKKFWSQVEKDYVIGAVLASEIDKIVKNNLGKKLNDREREDIFECLLGDNHSYRMDWIVESIEEALDVKFPNTIIS